MKIAILNKTKMKMPYKQLSLILTILLLLFTFSFACSPAVNPTDNNVFTPNLHIKVSDGSTDITDNLSITVDNSNLISITGLSNTIAAEDKTYTLTIAPEPDLFSTEGDITITITEPQDPSPGDVVPSPNGFTITNVSDPDNSIRYTIVVPFSGAPVGDWFDTSYIEATFARQTASSLILSEKILSVIGLTNVSDGTGTISFTLPLGFEADPVSIELDNPDGAATISPNPAAFKIRETGKPENFEDYTINTIDLAAVTAFTPGVHIVITDDNTSSDVPDLAFRVDENDSNKIIISGLVNSIGTGQTYTLTINPEMNLFSTGDNPISIIISEPDGFSPEKVTLPSGFTITNDNDSENPIPYTVEVQFSGAAVEDWLTSDSLSEYITATFASQTASLILNGYTLSVNGLINVDSGEGTISFNLPDGFEANPDPFTFTDPDEDGTGPATITLNPPDNTFTISETDNSARSQEYTVSSIDLKNLIDFTPDEHIVITDDTSSDRVPGLTIRVDENDTTKIIIVSGLVNSIGADKTYTLTIAPVEDGFSTSSGDDIIITITEPQDFSPGLGVLSQGDGVPSPDKFTITNVSDPNTSIQYTLEVPFTGAQVVDWLTSDSLSEYITVTFASQEASLILDGYNLSVNGLTNVDTGEGTISFELPPGFVAVPESIPLTDPDDAGTGETTINLSSPDNTFTISETGNADNNSQQYTVDNINLSSLTVFTPGEHIVITDDTSSNPVSELAFRVDENDSTKIIISGRGLINALTEKTYTLTINSVTGVFSTQGNNPIAINIADPTGFSPGPGVLTPSNSFTITNDIGSSEIPYTVEVQFRGAPVVDWLTEMTFPNYFTGATFAGQTLGSGDLIFNFDENSITIDGSSNLNYVPGAVPQLTTMDNIPSGYMLTQNLSAPVGSGLDAITNVDVGTITIAEENNPDDNEQEYPVTISLGAYASPVMASHISVTGFDPSSTDPNDIIIEIDQNIITISGLANGTSGSASVTITPPTTGEYTVVPDSLSFDDPDGTDVAVPEGTVDIVSAGFTVSHTVILNLKAYESPVEASQISVTGFDGSSININPNNIRIERNIITISALANGTSGSASVSITPPTTGEYTVAPDLLTFTDPPGTDSEDLRVDDAVSVTSAGVIASHTVILSLEAYTSPVEASHVTATFNGIPADPTNIVISGTNIIISGFLNIDGNTGMGTVSITPPTDGYTIDPATPLPLTFTDPAGFDSQDLVAGTVSVKNAGATALHTITISFSAPISLKINSNYVPSGTVTILKDGTVTLTGLGACELLPPPTFEIDGSSATVTGFPSYFDRRKDDIPTGSDSYTLDRVLILEGATSFSVRIEGFPACDDATIFTNSGKTGADADTAYEIDSAPKLELLSHLVSTDNATYASKFYKLTDDIDLGLAGLPWSEEASGTDGEGFPPIGLTDTTFQGTFDCANNSISNLYINREDNDNIGLFGFTSGAYIQNCSLINVNVSGDNTVGSFVGILTSSSSITNSYATGDVEGTNNVGGLAGRLYNSSITDSYATGSVEGNKDIGGLVGLLQGNSNIYNSYATGSVEGTGNEVGGLAGRLYNSSITDSYATGSVEGTSNVGGLVGQLYSSNITNSYATGSVSGTGSVGGLAGSLEFNSSITNSYWDTDTSEQMTSAGVGDGAAVGKSTTDLKTGSASVDIFTDWNNPDTVWKFDPDTQYPRLITVVCANRQYADPNNVPTDCTALP